MRDDDESNPKYLNTVETPLFRKRELLYGLPNLAAAKAAGAVFVVEGNFDMLGLHHAGVTNVVAALGTALTLEHLALLRGYVERLDLVLDADPAGQTATLRSLLLEGIEAFDVGVIPLSGGKDPDEIVREDPTAWAGLVAGRIRRWEYLWRRTAAPFEERIGSDVEARVDWKDAWCRLVSEQVADRENGERLLSRLERRLELPAGVLGSEYLLELPAARTEADELLLIALARDWAVRRHAAPLLPLGKAAGAICERWQRTGAPELVGRLAERAGSEGESAELAWTMALRGELGAKIRERIGLLTQMAAGLNGAEELASEARALYTLL
jgi:DNA primase